VFVPEPELTREDILLDELFDALVAYSLSDRVRAFALVADELQPGIDAFLAEAGADLAEALHHPSVRELPGRARDVSRRFLDGETIDEMQAMRVTEQLFGLCTVIAEDDDEELPESAIDASPGLLALSVTLEAVLSELGLRGSHDPFARTQAEDHLKEIVEAASALSAEQLEPLIAKVRAAQPASE
jgi:hypothetical protein